MKDMTPQLKITKSITIMANRSALECTGARVVAVILDLPERGKLQVDVAVKSGANFRDLVATLRALCQVRCIPFGIRWASQLNTPDLEA